MHSLRLVVLATAATAAFSSAAFAADLLSPPPMAEPVVDNSFHWDGPYVGLLLQGQSVPTAFGLGADLGVNALMDSVLLGGELEGVLSSGGNFSVQGTGKIGGLITDNMVAYAFTGIGTRSGTHVYVPVGIGAEVAVASNLGLKAEAQYNFDADSPAQDSAAIKVGLNWHF